MSSIVPFRGETPRQPPASFEAEMALLAAILANNRGYDAVAEFLKPEHFADPNHGRIFEACGALIERGMTANPLTVARYFQQDGQLAEVGGTEYLARLAGAVMSIINAKDYGFIILDAWQRRVLLPLLDLARDQCYQPPVEAGADVPLSGETIIERLAGALASIEAGSDTGGPRPFAEGIAQAVETADRAAKAGGAVTGVTTGLTDLDAALGGLHAPDLIIIAGRPGMGKTGFAQTIMRGAAKAGHHVLCFSLEMSAEQLGQRELALETGLGTDKQRQGKLSVEEIGRLVQARPGLGAMPIMIDDTPAISPQRMRARALRVKRKHGLDLVVVDYLQLIGGVAAENRTQEVTKITGGLKAMAKALAVPVVALSQLSRRVEERDDKRPLLSDLRESGSVEQDADVVIFLYRHEYYIARREPQRRAGDDDEKFAKRHAAWLSELDKWRGIAELLIEKNRQGPVATVRACFDQRAVAFKDLAKNDDDEI